jgi:hypothetical protein
MDSQKKTKPKLEDIELHADAWKRFERGVRKLVKAPPQPHNPKPSRAKRTSRKASKKA